VLEVCYKNRQACSLSIIAKSEDVTPITSRRLKLSHLPYDVFGFLPTPMKSKCRDRREWKNWTLWKRMANR